MYLSEKKYRYYVKKLKTLFKHEYLVLNLLACCIKLIKTTYALFGS